eukprot:9394655-Pyramimonas_sp.AAC.1
MPAPPRKRAPRGRECHQAGGDSALAGAPPPPRLRPPRGAATSRSRAGWLRWRRRAASRAARSRPRRTPSPL